MKSIPSAGKDTIAIERLKFAADLSERIYEKPLLITDSGGKDSSVCKQLAIISGINFEVLHSHTTADAPETVRFVRSEFSRLEGKGIKCNIKYPYYKGNRVSMWSLIPQKLMPPTRLVRYCCEVLKEQGGKGRLCVTGVRWDESIRRKNTRGIFESQHKELGKRITLLNDNDESRRLFENCQLKAKQVCNPIVDWTEADVWDFLRAEKVPTNPLYECGFSRIGCIGCPMAGKHRTAEFARYPAYKELYIRSFDRMIDERIHRGKLSGAWRMGTTGRDVYHWWMEDGVIPGQISLEDLFPELSDTA